jgi:branched-chain amino acid transport system permease protein
VAKIGGRGQAFSLPPGTFKVGPWEIDSMTEGAWALSSDVKVYFFGLMLMALCLLALGNMLRSKVGRAWVAIRDNDIAAETMGVNIVGYKLLAFFTAGFFAGIAGAFNLTTSLSVSPEHYEWYYSLIWVGIILIGGVGSIQGLVFGSIFVVVVMELVKNGADFIVEFLAVYLPALSYLSMKVIYFKDAAFGLAIIFFLIYEPNGLAYRYWQIKNYFNLWPFSYTGK